jgi:hypothetical protein
MEELSSNQSDGLRKSNNRLDASRAKRNSDAVPFPEKKIEEYATSTNQHIEEEEFENEDETGNVSETGSQV